MSCPPRRDRSLPRSILICRTRRARRRGHAVSPVWCAVPARWPRTANASLAGSGDERGLGGGVEDNGGFEFGGRIKGDTRIQAGEAIQDRDGGEDRGGGRGRTVARPIPPAASAAGDWRAPPGRGPAGGAVP